MINVKKPKLFLFIWFMLGLFGYTFGLEVLSMWILFGVGVVGLYTIFAR